ncbi:MAG: type II toxin-antitoxin system RelE/ParE family toxin [Magnetococcales bacterium]|nr:type II toxin-antitoxin system RelE/ParE family toxin [Magnetococcales bacterium]
MFEILEYITIDGQKPFAAWLLAIKDKRTQAKIRARIARASLGNFGDWKSLENSGGICEMREHYGPGYRIFYKRVGNRIILLLAGSMKPDQEKTVKQARDYLADYERRIEP